MSEHISFDTIPGSIRVPGQYIEFNTRNAVQGLPQNPQRVLLLAPMFDHTKQEPLKPVQMFSDAQADELFGYGSWAKVLVTQAFKNNPYLDLTVIGLPDSEDGARARGTIDLLSRPEQNGTLDVSVAGRLFSVAVYRDESTVDIAKKMALKIDSSDWVVDVIAAGTTLEFYARNAGEIGNEIELQVNANSTGIVLDVSPMVGGEINADVSEALSRVAGANYQIIVCPFSDEKNLRALNEHIEHVSNAIEQRGCIGVIGHRGKLADGVAKAASLNSGRITCAWYKNADESNGQIAMGYAAVLAFEEDPAKPLNTLQIKGLNITADEYTPLFAECNSALYNGLTPLTVVANKVQIMRAVSTYTQSASGVEDPSLLDITTIRTLDYVRRAIKERIALRFPRDKLSDRLLPKIRSEILDVLLKLEQAEIIENVEANKPKLIVARSGQDPNRVNAAIPADVVNGLHVFAGRIDLIL